MKILVEYKEVDGFPAYRVSNTGIVQSRWQQRASYCGFFTEDVWKDLVCNPNKKGYMQVALCDGMGKHKTHRVHNLVAAAFIGKRPRGMVIRHLNSNPKDNRAENLVYGSYAENENDKILNGTYDMRCGGATLSSNDIFTIRELLLRDIPQKEIAKQYNVSRPTITRIANKSIWRNL